MVSSLPDLCNRFGEYFESVYQKSDQHDINWSLLSVDCVELVVSNSSVTVVLSLMKSLNVRTAASIDGISSFIIKDIAKIVASILALLFYWNIMSGAHP